MPHVARMGVTCCIIYLIERRQYKRGQLGVRLILPFLNQCTETRRIIKSHDYGCCVFKNEHGNHRLGK